MISYFKSKFDATVASVSCNPIIFKFSIARGTFNTIFHPLSRAQTCLDYLNFTNFRGQTLIYNSFDLVQDTKLKSDGRCQLHN